MATWEDFEIQCTKYLNTKFGEYATFTHKGGADSTVPDIHVKTNTGKSFYIEAKCTPAQCGQFVLLPNIESQTLVYSHLNANRVNAYAEMIINHMNTDYTAYRDAGTTGKTINMPGGSEIFANWIIMMYRNKGVRFFITNNYTILPLEQFLDYFDVSACYRVKRSGSSDVGKNNFKQVMDYIESQKYIISGFRTEDNKLFVVSSQSLNKKRFTFMGTEYMFSQRGNEYELRRLSNTNNANVIFSITYKHNTKGMSDDEFIACLN